MRCTDLVRVGALALTLVSLASCSEYLVRRDAISPFGGNAVEGDKVVQMADPWPREAADNRIGYNGTVIQSAVERYRTGRVIQPKGTGTSGTYQPPSAPQNTAPVGPSINQPASTK
jgi:hypothetical protein